jgi:hypothetical protein
VTTWKARERGVAKRLGGRRIPVTGIDRDGADVETPLLCVQAKHGRRRPGYLKGWLDGIRATASARGKVGVVVWSLKHERGDEAVVLLALRDFEALHGSIGPAAAVSDGAVLESARTKEGHDAAR